MAIVEVRPRWEWTEAGKATKVKPGELEVLARLCDGRGRLVADVAVDFGIGEAAAYARLRFLREKLGVDNDILALLKAVDLGMMTLEFDEPPVTDEDMPGLT